MLSSLDDAIGFLRDFHASKLKDVQGLTVDALEIPDALRKLYAAFGDPMNPTSIHSGQDTLAGPAKLRRIGDYVHFLDENQGCWSCAYRVEDGPDPAVYLFDDSSGEPTKQSDSLSQFLVTFLLQESVVTATPFGAIQEHGILPQEALHEPVEPLWMEAIYSGLGPTHWFYWCKTARILIMRFDGDYAPFLWMAAYEDRWESSLKDCSGGYVINAPSGEQVRCHDSNPPPAKKRLPRWLRWLE